MCACVLCIVYWALVLGWMCHLVPAAMCHLPSGGLYQVAFNVLYKGLLLLYTTLYIVYACMCIVLTLVYWLGWMCQQPVKMCVLALVLGWMYCLDGLA